MRNCHTHATAPTTRSVLPRRHPGFYATLGRTALALAVLAAASCEPSGSATEAADKKARARAAGEAAAADASEPYATYAESLPTGALCIVNRPLTRDAAPVVILAHQLNSDKAAPAPPMARLAETLASRGIATYRLYYDNSPEADAVTITYDSPERLVEEIRAVFDQLRMQEREGSGSRGWVDTKRIGLVGYDVGALLAAASAVEGDLKPRALVLWSPPKSFRAGFTSLLGHPPGDKDMLVHFEDRRVLLAGSFVQQLDVIDPLESIRKYHGALLGITGGRSVEGLAGLREYIANSGATSHDTVVIDGADAALGMDGQNPAATDRAIQETADWLERAL